MKLVRALLLSLLSVSLVYCQECEVSEMEFACFQSRFSSTVTNLTAFGIACADADFVAVQGGDLSSLCDIPDCISQLSELGYVPCGRPDLENCIRSSCDLPTIPSDISLPLPFPSTECTLSDEDLECIAMQFSRTENTETNFTAFDVACQTADFSAVLIGDLTSLCDIPNCITLLGEIGYEPCDRADITDCVRNECGLPTASRPNASGAVKMYAAPLAAILAVILAVLN